MSADQVFGTMVVDLTGPLPTREIIGRTRKDDDLTFFGTDWSPDSRRIAGTFYSSASDDRQAIGVYTVADEMVETVYRVGTDQEVFSPIWTPDGERIVLVQSTRDGQADLLILSLDGSEPRPIWSFTRTWDSSLVLAPEHRSLLHVEVSRSSDLWLAPFE